MGNTTKSTRLTWNQVRLARMFYVNVGLSQMEIAQRLGVTQSYIAQLSLMRTWIEDTPSYRVPDYEDRERLRNLWLTPDVTDGELREAFLAVAEQTGVITAAKARERLDAHREYTKGLVRISTDSEGYVTRVEGVPEEGHWKDYPGLCDAINGLIGRVMAEMERVWGPSETQGFDGTTEQYAWLEQHYGITEDDDVHWQFILQDSWGEKPDDLNEDDGETREFLASPHAIVGHLNFLLERYRSNTLSHTGDAIP